MLHHRPHARNITRREQDLAVVPAEKLVTDIQNSGRHVDPHEREMPLQCSAQPAADGERLRPMQQVFLWNLRAEAGESAENLKTAAHHHKQRDCIHPVTEPHNKWMLVSRARDHDGLVVFPFCLNDFDNTTAHAGSSRPQIPPGLKPASSAGLVGAAEAVPFQITGKQYARVTSRKTTNSPGLPSSQLCRARASLSTRSNTLPACSQSSSESAAAAARRARASAAARTSRNKVRSADAVPSPYPATHNSRRRSSR